MTEPQIIDGIAVIARRIGRLDPSRVITGNDRLVEDLGIDSLDLVGIYLEIQDQFGVEVEESDVPQLGRIGDLAAYVLQRRGPSSAAA